MMADDDDEVPCVHCAIMKLLSDRIDAGEEPTQLHRGLVQALAEFMSWNRSPGGRAKMLATAIEDLPGLVAEEVEATEQQKRSLRLLQ